MAYGIRVNSPVHIYTDRVRSERKLGEAKNEKERGVGGVSTFASTPGKVYRVLPRHGRKGLKAGPDDFALSLSLPSFSEKLRYV